MKVFLAEDFYKNRKIRVYKKICPCLRSGREGIKVVKMGGTSSYDDWLYRQAERYMEEEDNDNEEEDGAEDETGDDKEEKKSDSI